MDLQSALSVSVPIAKAREVVRLVGEFHELRDSPEERLLHTCANVARLVDAAASGILTMDEFRSGGRREIRRIDDGGWASRRIRESAIGGLLAAGHLREHPMFGDASPLVRSAGGPVAALRADTCDARTWDAYTEATLRPVSLDDGLAAAAPFDRPGAVFLIGVYRERGRRGFAECERAVLALVAEQLAGSLLRSQATAPRLAARERETLEHLLSGRSEREIAARLMLSPHTVHHYIKRLFRAFQVHSRPELLAKCLRSRR